MAGRQAELITNRVQPYRPFGSLSAILCRRAGLHGFHTQSIFSPPPPHPPILILTTGQQTGWKEHFRNKKHLKNVGPIRYCEPFYIVIHQVSLLPPAHRCPRRRRQRQRVTEGTAMAPWNGPNDLLCVECVTQNPNSINRAPLKPGHTAAVAV